VQLYHLNRLYDDFRRAGVAIYAITAQPGGSEEICSKLLAAGLPEMKVPVFSDPSWSLMTLEPQDGIYVENPAHGFLLKMGAFNEPYRMVQPAMVVVDGEGRVVYWWSWNTLPSGAQAEDGVLPNGWNAESNKDGNSHDVRFRPVPDDLLRILSEGGDLEKLQKLRVENLGFPNEKDHANTKKSFDQDPRAAAVKKAELEKQEAAKQEAAKPPMEVTHASL